MPDARPFGYKYSTDFGCATNFFGAFSRGRRPGNFLRQAPQFKSVRRNLSCAPDFKSAEFALTCCEKKLECSSVSVGVVAQLVEHHNGIVGVRGSNPLGSTIPKRKISFICGHFLRYALTLLYAFLSRLRPVYPLCNVCKHW